MSKGKKISMSKKIDVDGLSVAIKAALVKYNEATAEEVKAAVKEAAKTVKQQIEKNAPKDTGAYSRSWKIKTIRETSNTIELKVHSKSHYQLTHLLEYGHAKRNGGRVAGKVHIAPAEALGNEQLEEAIRKVLKG